MFGIKQIPRQVHKWCLIQTGQKPLYNLRLRKNRDSKILILMDQPLMRPYIL